MEGPVIGIWPLDEGASSFGSDRSLPIVLPATQVVRPQAVEAGLKQLPSVRGY